MIRHGLLVLLLTFPIVSGAQEVPDTTDAWSYYPLAVGNIWEYDGQQMNPYDYRVEIVGDTLIDGVQYFLEAYSEPLSADGARQWRRVGDARAIRFDTSLAMVLARRSDGDEQVWHPGGCPLDSAFGAIAECAYTTGTLVTGGYGQSFTLADGTVLSGVTYKQFEPTLPFYGYVAGLGHVWTDLRFEPWITVLAYARIDGVEYGTPLPTSNDEPPLTAPAANLSVVPNPVTAQSTVHLLLHEPAVVRVAIYDLLGRELIRLHDQGVPITELTIPARTSMLASGPYVVRVESAGRPIASRLAVVR
jgi:hypothetical protein